MSKIICVIKTDRYMCVCVHLTLTLDGDFPE